MVLPDRVVRHLTVVTPRESCVLARTGGPARPSPTRDDGGAMRAVGTQANDSPAAAVGRDSLAEHLDGEGVLSVRRQPAIETAATFEPVSHRNRRGYAGGRSEPPRGRLAMMSTVRLFDLRPARCRKAGRPGGFHHLRPSPPSRRAASVRRTLGVPRTGRPDGSRSADSSGPGRDTLSPADTHSAPSYRVELRPPARGGLGRCDDGGE